MYSEDTDQDEKDYLNKIAQKEFRNKLSTLMEQYNVKIFSTEKHEIRFVLDEINRKGDIEQFHSSFTISGDGADHWDLA